MPSTEYLPLATDELCTTANRAYPIRKEVSSDALPFPNSVFLNSLDEQFFLIHGPGLQLLKMEVPIMKSRNCEDYSFTKFPSSSIMSFLQKFFRISRLHSSLDSGALLCCSTSIMQRECKTNSPLSYSAHSIASNCRAPSVPSTPQGSQGIARTRTPRPSAPPAP